MNNYLSKVFFIIENYSKKLSILPNDTELRIHVVDQIETYFIMAKNTEISSVANTIKKWHIQSNFNLIYQQDLYKDKQKEIYDSFIEYLVSVMYDPDIPALIEEWKQNLDAADYEKKLNQDVKLPSKRKK